MMIKLKRKEKKQKPLEEPELDNFNTLLLRLLKEVDREEESFPDVKYNVWYYTKNRLPPNNKGIIVTHGVRYDSFDISEGSKERQHVLMDIHYWKKKVEVDRWMLIK